MHTLLGILINHRADFQPHPDYSTLGKLSDKVSNKILRYPSTVI